MNPPDYLFYIGIDRADAKLDICQLDPDTTRTTDQIIGSKPESLSQWVSELRQQLLNSESGRVAICIEQPCASVAVFLHQFDFIDLYLVNPKMLKAYRESLHLAGAKDDRKDANCLALMLSERYMNLRAWKPDSAEVRRLDFTLRHRRNLVDQRTALTNQLTAILKDYFPQALELTGKELHARLACDFLMKWPTLAAVSKASDQQIRQFYILHKSHRPSVIAKRIEVIRNAIELTNDQAIIRPNVMMVKSLTNQLNALRGAIEKFDLSIRDLMATNEDAAIFRSLPGAGEALAPRLLVTLGSDRSRFESAESLQCFTGIAPVTKQSGQRRTVHRRYAKYVCPRFQHQGFVEWVGQTVPRSVWARAYYDQQKEKGVGHWAILRGLAYKWQRIIFRCWQNRECYDEQKYLKALRRAKSPLISRVNAYLNEQASPEEKT
mgnify:CR=1 FL=1